MAWELKELTKLKDLSHLKFEGIAFTCLCGKKAKAGKVNGEYCVLHQEPLCIEFVQKEPADYLKWVRLGKS